MLAAHTESLWIWKLCGLKEVYYICNSNTTNGNVLSGVIFHYGQCNGQNAAAAAAKSLQSCPTLCNPRDGSPPGSPVPGILQARTLEWVAISFSNAWRWKVKVKSLSRVQLLATPWTAAYQAPPSMGFSRQEYWSGVPLPSLKHRLLEKCKSKPQWDNTSYQSEWSSWKSLQTVNAGDSVEKRGLSCTLVEM